MEYKNCGGQLSEDRKKITFTDRKNIGTVKLKGTRDLNFYPIDQIKRVRIVKRADGYYVQFCLSVDIREYAKLQRFLIHSFQSQVMLLVRLLTKQKALLIKARE